MGDVDGPQPAVGPTQAVPAHGKRAKHHPRHRLRLPVKTAVRRRFRLYRRWQQPQGICADLQRQRSGKSVRQRSASLSTVSSHSKDDGWNPAATTDFSKGCDPVSPQKVKATKTHASGKPSRKHPKRVASDHHPVNHRAAHGKNWPPFEGSSHLHTAGWDSRTKVITSRKKPEALLADPPQLPCAVFMASNSSQSMDINNRCARTHNSSGG